jgi:hypothetical protein
MVRRADGERAATEHVTVSAELVQAGSTAAALLDSVLTAHPTASVVETPGGEGATATAVVARTIAGQPVRQRVALHVMPTRYAGDVTTALTVVATWPELDDAAAATVCGIQDSFSVTGV